MVPVIRAAEATTASSDYYLQAALTLTGVSRAVFAKAVAQSAFKAAVVAHMRGDLGPLITTSDIGVMSFSSGVLTESQPCQLAVGTNTVNVTTSLTVTFVVRVPATGVPAPYLRALT